MDQLYFITALVNGNLQYFNSEYNAFMEEQRDGHEYLKWEAEILIKMLTGSRSYINHQIDMTPV